ncbi:hypothetical protein RRF57_008920 [Xylaria bambusicola]|uniref:Secreted protein n=1 Tax=Xylaria bambusicola TaxID=326684 RepID=A0AAN7UW35_9PEZI
MGLHATTFFTHRSWAFGCLAANATVEGSANGTLPRPSKAKRSKRLSVEQANNAAGTISDQVPEWRPMALELGVWVFTKYRVLQNHK